MTCKYKNMKEIFKQINIFHEVSGSVTLLLDIPRWREGEPGEGGLSSNNYVSIGYWRQLCETQALGLKLLCSSQHLLQVNNFA